MQNSIKIIVLLFVMIIQISANNKHYVGVGEAISYANTHTISKDKMIDLTLKYGYTITDYIDMEARGNFQFFNGIRLNHTFSYGIFLRPNYDITEKTNIYGLIGYSKNKLVKKDINYTNRDTVQYDFSYGAGIEYSFGHNRSIYIDYIQYINKSIVKPEGKYAIKIDSINFGITYKFGNKKQKIKKSRKSLKNVYISPIKQTKEYCQNFGLEGGAMTRYVKSLKTDQHINVEIRSYSQNNGKNVLSCARQLKKEFIEKGIEKERIIVAPIKNNQKQDYIRVIRRLKN